MARPRSTNPRSVTSIRLTAQEREDMERAAAEQGFTSLSNYLRELHQGRMRALVAMAGENHEVPRRPPVTEFHRTKLGTIFHGDALTYMFDVAKPASVDLIVTSPPFGLVRKKSYGNEDAHAYCEWFRPFADGFRRVLKETGSLVIDIGGAWKKGTPTRSLYHFELLLMLCNEFKFHLCLEHYWWNPSKLPTPAEWVNVRRVRVKDAVNTVWWLSLTPWPKANNRRVLAPYSESQKNLFKNGYKAKLRPSGHDISTKFGRDNGGAVPPNLLAIANTESNGVYQDYCRKNGLPVHPARFPHLLPAYFIRMLTDPGDFVYDPFGGSCVAGAVAESLGRRWATTELSEGYLKGALARFSERELRRQAAITKTKYEIAGPCGVAADENSCQTIEDGGRARPSVASRRGADPVRSAS